MASSGEKDSTGNPTENGFSLNDKSKKPLRKSVGGLEHQLQLELEPFWTGNPMMYSHPPGGTFGPYGFCRRCGYCGHGNPYEPGGYYGHVNPYGPYGPGRQGAHLFHVLQRQERFLWERNKQLVVFKDEIVTLQEQLKERNRQHDELQNEIVRLQEQVKETNRQRDELQNEIVSLQEQVKVSQDGNRQEFQVGDLKRCPCATDVLEVLKCSICHDLMVEPHLLQCGHSGCRDCVKKWLSQNNGNHCHECRTSASFENAVQDRPLNGIIQIAEKKCLSAEEVEKRKKKEEERRNEELKAVAGATPLFTTDAADLNNTITGIGNSELLELTGEGNLAAGALC